MHEPCFEPLESRVHFAAAPTILFIRGATRSGGFLEGGSIDARNEQLADINNTSTAAGNHGWATLAQTLRDAGFAVEQIAEAKESTAGAVSNGRPIRFENMDLTKYSAIVFGSNNARYPKESITAIQTYINNGGGALFISDANFGSHWRDAADSDQSFLARFGLLVNQDNGTYALNRADGHFIAADHPVLDGVNSFDGEGVSPLIVPATAAQSPPGVTITRVAAARNQTRNNDGVDPAENYAGSLRPVNSRDASLVVAHAGAGRVAAYFDRNTFFNANGIGSDIHKLDNRQLALNLFGWAADSVAPRVASSTFKQGAPSEVRITFDDDLNGSLSRKDVLLRDPFDATPVPKNRWSFAVNELSNGQTELVIAIKGAQPAGTYQLQINRGRVQDDAGNPNARVRFNFTIAASAASASLASVTTGSADVTPAVRRAADELFNSGPTIGG
jgi:hypothetical protein